MFCSTCGIQLRDEARFCSGCGLAVNALGTPSTAALVCCPRLLPSFAAAIACSYSLHGDPDDRKTSNARRSSSEQAENSPYSSSTP